MSQTQSKDGEISTSQPKKSLVFSFKFLFTSFFVLCNAYFVLAFFPQTNTLSFLNNLFGISNFHTSKMASADSDQSWNTATNIYGFTAKSIDGDNVELSKYKYNRYFLFNFNCNFYLILF